MKPVIKICGMRDAVNIIAAAELKPDIMGFIFYSGSPRFAGECLKPEIVASLPSGIRKAGVFVNAEYEEITETAGRFSLNMAQLHGNETPELCRRIKDSGISVIRAFNISDSMNFEKCKEFSGSADYFLFDAMTANHGGSGQKFDWKLLERFETGIPFFLSGGISPSDTNNILGISNPALYGIDLNSRFEIKPGLKDIKKLEKFINEIRLKQ